MYTEQYPKSIVKIIAAGNSDKKPPGLILADVSEMFLLFVYFPDY